MPSMTPGRWARDLLQRMELPTTRQNLIAVLAWERAEGGHFANSARYNPLNTTMDMPGDTIVNSHGVRAYGSYEQGMDATVKTLRLPAYAGVRKALREGDSASGVANAVIASPWGTTSLMRQTIPGATSYVDAHRSLTRPTSSAKPAPSKKGSGREQGTGALGSGGRGDKRRISVDPDELASLATTLDRIALAVRGSAGRADTLVATLHRVANHAIDTPVATTGGATAVDPRRAEVALDVRRAAANLWSRPETLGDVERHLTWEADLTRRVRAKAVQADGTGWDRKSSIHAALAAKGAKPKPKPKPGGATPGASTKPKPKPKPKPATKPAKKRPRVGLRALKAAMTQRNVREVGNNGGTAVHGFQKTTGAMNQAWCASFVTWSLLKAGKNLPANRGPLAAVSNWVGMARRKEFGFSIVSAKDARPGDIVAYDWDGGADYAGASHIGIMKSRVSGGRFQAIEGNTSAGSGEGVAVRSRTTSVAPNVCFIRVGSSS